MTVPARLQPYLFAAIACLGLAAYAGYDLVRERDRSIAHAKDNTANLARLLDEHTRLSLLRVADALADAEVHIGDAAEFAPGSARLQTLEQDLKSSLPRDGLVSALSWRGGDARTLASTTPLAARASADEAFGPWLLSISASPPARLAFGRPARGPSGAWQMPVARSVVTRDGRPAGTLSAVVNLGVLQPVLDAVDTGRNGFVTLFLADGWMLATAPRNEALLSRNWSDAPMFKEHLPRSPVGTVQQVVVRDGTERVYSYRALTEYPVVVSIGISMTDALAEWRTRAWRDALLLAVVTVALLLGAAAMARTYGRQQAAERASAAARDEAQRSERFLRDITDNLPLRIAYVDRELRYGFVNQAHCERYGLAREAIVGHTRQALTGLAPPAELLQRIEQVLAGRPQRLEIEEGSADGLHMIEIYLVPDVGAEGAVAGFYAASSDVTERHRQQRRIERALAERETLLREVYHRVKNNLQVIQSLLNLQRRSLPEGLARSALDESIQRVHAMALVHEKLYQTGDLDAIALRDYSNDLLRHLGDTAGAAQRGIELRADIDAVEASLEVALPFGLLLTELVSNSLKHGFPDGRAGSIRVGLHREGSQVWLRVSDDGVGLPAGFDIERSDSMGLQLAASLARQLGGTLQARGDGGAEFAAALTRLA
jgi:PAS domain S-box-containing protein